MTKPTEDAVIRYPADAQASVLPLTRIRALTDAAMTAFVQWHEIETQARRVAKEKLAAEMANLDVLGLTANKASALAEEYQPADSEWRS